MQLVALSYKASFSFNKVHSYFIMISTIKASFILSHAHHAHVLSFMPSLSFPCQFSQGLMIQSQQCLFPTTLPLDCFTMLMTLHYTKTLGLILILLK